MPPENDRNRKGKKEKTATTRRNPANAIRRDASLAVTVTIRKNALLSALEGSKNMHPDEFIALFRGEERLSEERLDPSGSNSSGKTKTQDKNKSRKDDQTPDLFQSQKTKAKPDLLLTELIIPPFAHGDEDSSSYSPYFIPANSREKASFHSHPDPDTAYPSDEDLYYFSKESGIHFIACWPFRLQDVACFDKDGKPVRYGVI